jgi:hypothetical protein
MQGSIPTAKRPAHQAPGGIAQGAHPQDVATGKDPLGREGGEQFLRPPWLGPRPPRERNRPGPARRRPGAARRGSHVLSRGGEFTRSAPRRGISARRGRAPYRHERSLKVLHARSNFRGGLVPNGPIGAETERVFRSASLRGPSEGTDGLSRTPRGDTHPCGQAHHRPVIETRSGSSWHPETTPRRPKRSVSLSRKVFPQGGEVPPLHAATPNSSVLRRDPRKKHHPLLGDAEKLQTPDSTPPRAARPRDCRSRS